MKKNLLLLSALLVFSLVGCTTKQNTSSSESKDTPSSSETSSETQTSSSQESSGEESSGEESTGEESTGSETTTESETTSESESTSESATSEEITSEDTSGQEEEKVYTLYVNNVASNIANVVPDGWTDKAVFTVNLEALDEVAVKYGEEYVPFEAEGVAGPTSMAVETAGEYRVGVNANDLAWLAAVTPEPVESVYKVVGTIGGENKWDYATSEIGFVDATKEEEVAQEWYVTQEKAEFDVLEGDAFKVLPAPEDWDHALAWSSLNPKDENFEEGENGNIVAKYAGSVDLYLKHFANETLGLSIVFEKDEGGEPEVKVYTLYINDEASEAESVVPEGWTDKAVFTVTLAAQDKVAIKYDDVYVPFEVEGVAGAASMTVETAGDYRVGVNANDLAWLAAVTPEPVESVYKVVGTIGGENKWDYAASEIGFVDATKEEEVAQEWYVTQEKAEFDVLEGDAFKVLPAPEDWEHALAWSSLNPKDENFEEGENGNIVAKYAGSVDLYLKHFANETLGLSIVFEKAEGGEQQETYTLTVTLNLETEPTNGAFIIYDINRSVDNDWINQAGLDWYSMAKGEGIVYTYELTGLKEGDVVRFQFATWLEGNQNFFLSGDASWKPASVTMGAANLALTCTAAAFPTSTSETVVFTVA